MQIRLADMHKRSELLPGQVWPYQDLLRFGGIVPFEGQFDDCDNFRTVAEWRDHSMHKGEACTQMGEPLYSPTNQAFQQACSLAA